MSAAVFRVAWRLGLCLGVSWLVWRVGGLVPMVATAALYGVLLARPVIDLVSELRHQTRVLVWRPLEGRHFVYRGTPVQVLEDDAGVRWVRVADVRRSVGFTSTDGVLALTYPDGCRPMGRPPQPHLADETLLVHLRKEGTAEANRFMHWAERTIAFPARRRRALRVGDP